MAGIGMVSALGPGSGSAAVMGGAAPVPDWWDLGGTIACCVAAYQPKGAASYAASLINLANPGTYDATAGVAPTWAAGTGWSFDGTQWLSSGYDANVNTCSIIARFANVVNDDNIGTAIGDGRNALQPIYFANHLYRNGLAQFPLGANVAAGIMMVTPTDAFLNGVSEGPYLTDGVNKAGPLLLGADGNGGVPYAGEHLTGDIIAIGIYSCDISAFALALATAMAAP